MKKQKNEKAKYERKRNTPREAEDPKGVVLDWRPLLMAFREATEWALDIACALAREFPEEVAAVERVRIYLRKRIAGIPAHLDETDLLFTFGLLIGAIERDLGPISKRVTGSLAPAIWLPGADVLSDLLIATTHEAWERLARSGIAPRSFNPRSSRITA